MKDKIKFAYALPLEPEEVAACYHWQGRNSWSIAACDAMRADPEFFDPEEMPQGPGLYFESEVDAWEFRDACDEDGEGGHSLFSGITFDDKMLQFLDSIV